MRVDQGAARSLDRNIRLKPLTPQRTSYRINRGVLLTAEVLWELDDEGLNTHFFNIPKTSAQRKTLWSKYYVAKVLFEAHAYLDEKAIYFVHTLDSRGRIYPQATYLNPQGSDLSRVLIAFSKGKPIKDADAKKWLANHGACCYGDGLSKKTYAERISWVDDHKSDILTLAKDPGKSLDFWKKADKPWAFLAWCLEWSAFCEEGYGYVSHLPVAVDGTCNGFQHFAALTLSPDMAAHVNVLPSDHPRDLYQHVAEQAKAMVEDRVRCLPWFSEIPFNALFDKYDGYGQSLYRISQRRNKNASEKNRSKIIYEAVEEDGKGPRNNKCYNFTGLFGNIE